MADDDKPAKAPAKRKTAAKTKAKKAEVTLVPLTEEDLKPNKTGRPSKCTPEVRTVILNLIRRGNFRNTAAFAAGIDDNTLRRWMRSDEEPYASFAQEVLQAEADAEVAMVEHVVTAATQDAQHARWWLERKFQDRWARKERVEVSGTDGGPLQVSDAKDRLLGKLAGLVAAATAGRDPGGSEPGGSG